MKKSFRLTTMHRSKCENYFIKTWFPRSVHAATRNSEEERFFETFKAFKLLLGPLNLAKIVNESDFKISKQTPPVIV